MQGGYIGVDVFFVISGFLITGLLVRELERTGTVSLARFYARRAKRLLPAAVAVLIATVVLSMLLLSPVRTEFVARDVLASALYFVNWRFIAQSTDYFGATDEVSPVQHYWSLSIEEQFYLVWPALLLSTTWWWRRSGRDIRTALWFGLLALGAASLAYSIRFTAEMPSAAYFSTLTRGWEFALGGALALISLPRLPKPVAAALAGGGLAAIALATVAFTDTTPYPGSAALLPTLGAAAVIFGGAASPPSAPVRMLTLPPVRYVGRISYSWYLWHWPAVIFAQAAWGPLSTAETTLAIAASGIPSAITHQWIEEPFRRSAGLGRRPVRALALGSSCMCVGVISAVLLLAAQPTFQTAPASQVEGAAALREETRPQRKAGALRPDPLDAGRDRGRLYDDGCLVEPRDTRSGACVYGDRSSKTTVVLFGDSHAMQYFPALEEIAGERGWRVVGLTKAGCPPLAASVWNPRLNRDYHECEDWREHTLSRIEDEERPEMVVVSAASYYSVTEDGERLDDADLNRETLQSGYAKVLERLGDTGARVVVIKDLPHAPHDMPDCVSRSLDELDACAFAKSEARGGGFDVRAAEKVEGVQLLDLVPAICPDETCRAVVGDAIVYRGTNHLTATFARTLSPRIGHQLPRLGD